MASSPRIIYWVEGDYVLVLVPDTLCGEEGSGRIPALELTPQSVAVECCWVVSNQ